MPTGECLAHPPWSCVAMLSALYPKEYYTQQHVVYTFLREHMGAK